MAGPGVRIGVDVNSGPAEKGITSVRRSLLGLGADAKKSILTGVGLAGGIAAFSLLKNAIGGVTDYLGESVQAAVEDEASVSRLTASLRANVPAWEGTTTAIDKRIAAGQKLGFTDDAQRASLALLVGATHDVAKAQTLQAAAMDLARFKGIDLAEASDALVKVEGGRYRILASLGIKLKEGATATEVLAAVQKVAAGQAKAFGETTAGAAVAAGIAFEELQEDIGKQLMPVFRDLAKFALNDLIPALRDIGKAIGDVIGFMSDIGQAWATVGMDFGSMGDRIHSVADTMGLDFEQVKEQIKTNMLEAGMSFEDAATSAERSFKAMGTDGAAKLREGGGAVKAAAEAMAGEIPAALEEAKQEAIKIVRKTPAELAAALVAGQTDWQAAWDKYGDIMEDDLTRSAEMAKIKAILIGKELAAGLNSTDLERQASAEAMKATLESRLLALQYNVPGIARKTGTDYNTALAAFTSEIGITGASWASAVASKLAIDLTAAGRVASGTWMKGFVSTAYSDAAGWLAGLKRMLVGSSPPPEGPLKDIDKGGFNIGKAWADSFGKGIGTASLGLSGSGGLALPGAGGAMSGSPVVIQLQVDGRTLAEIVDRQLYYATPGASRFPRG